MRGRKRIYRKVEGSWVYALITPNDKYYFGYSDQEECHDRWRVSDYINGSFRKYIIKYGWQNIKKVVIVDNLTHDQAVTLEGLLIKAGKQMGICVNKNDSGGITKDIKQYEANRRKDPQRQQYLKNWADENREHLYAYQREWNKAHREEINARRRARYAELKQMS